MTAINAAGISRIIEQALLSTYDYNSLMLAYRDTGTLNRRLQNG